MNLVTGATGLLGSHIVEQLRRRNLPVRVLVRRGSDRSWLNTQGVEFAEGDVTDAASLQRAAAGCDVVFHSAAKVGDWGPWEDFQRITIDGTQNVIDAVAAAKVRRLVHISSISVYGYHTVDGTIDESYDLGFKLYKWAYYSKSKVEAERRVWAAHKAGMIEASVIRPAWIYGERDRTTIARLVTMVSQRRAKILGPGDNRLNVVYAGNVADGAILAATHPKAGGEAFNCSNDGEITQQQYFDLVARACGAPPVRAHAPYRAAYFAGFVLECIGHLTRSAKPPFVTRYAVWLMGRRSFFSAEKARRVLGWQTRVPYEVGVPNTVKWYLDNIRQPAGGATMAPAAG
ncbi:MAG: NAD-dependent epimerase/dehydratase family protein [Phycisphaerae bacterium]